ncbi:hypothetical protein So717_29410 [Roseobacter cerasinus]|uniref:Uncharacterized protein n=2 Tax=Roseobacter cerasinus TaxID=2602289 RepID=A0A640VS14_9RHOB|nr:hypothetical protein So717_29410 [Roseobacter cerasinus]
MLLSSTFSTVNLSLFSRVESNQGQAAKITQILAQSETGKASPEATASAYTVASSHQTEMEGVYPDPKISPAKASEASPATLRTMSALDSIRQNEFREIEASYQRAVENEIGKTLRPGERLTLEDSQSLSTDLRRTESKVNLLRLKLDIASGNIGQGQSIEVDWGDQTPPGLVTGPNASADAIAEFRTLQVQSVINMSQDGTLDRLAGETGGNINAVTGSIPSLTADELASMKSDFFQEQMKKG